MALCCRTSLLWDSAATSHGEATALWIEHRAFPLGHDHQSSWDELDLETLFPYLGQSSRVGRSVARSWYGGGSEEKDSQGQREVL